MTNEQKATAIQRGEDQNGDLLMALWGDNSGYIAAIIGNYDGLCDPNDLWQESFIGMMTAIQRWDPERGVPFMVFAGNWIRSAVGRYIQREQGIPINKQEKLYKLHKVENDFQLKHGRSPSDDEISNIMGLSVNELSEIRKAGYGRNTLSLDAPQDTDDGEYSLGDVVPGIEDPEADAVDHYEQDQLHDVLWGEVDRLPSEQAEVLHGRYESELTAKQVGELTGQSGQAVADTERRALTKLRTSPRSRKALLPFWSDDRIRSEALQGGSTGTFSRKWTSSTERVALKLAEREQ